MASRKPPLLMNIQFTTPDTLPHVFPWSKLAHMLMMTLLIQNLSKGLRIHDPRVLCGQKHPNNKRGKHARPPIHVSQQRPCSCATTTMTSYDRKRPRCLNATPVRGLLSLLVFASRASPGLSLSKHTCNDNIGFTADYRSTFDRIDRIRSVTSTLGSCSAFLGSSGMAMKALSHRIHSRCNFSRYTLPQSQEKTRLESCSIRRDDNRRSMRQTMVEMDAYGDGGKEGWSGRPKTRRPLVFLAEALNAAVLEMCVENQGRPLAMAITDVVERTIETFVAGENVETKDCLIFDSYLIS